MIQPDMVERIMTAVASRRQNILDDLTRLVSADSTLGNEAVAQGMIKEIYQGLQLEIDEVTIDLDALESLPGFSPPVTRDTHGRVNVIGLHSPREEKGKSLILNGHMDVVPTGPHELWHKPPFTPWIDGDWLYGRGAGDMKAGIVAYCHAFAALKDLGLQPAARVVMQSVIEEECTGNGALACLNAGYTADAAVIPEPFGQSCLVAQLGVMWFQLKLTGKPAHVLDTSNGSNVFDALNLVVDELKQLETEWNTDECRHHAFHQHAKPINFNLGKVNGGDWASTVACFCEADFRVGFYPGMSLEQVKQAVEETVAAAELPQDIQVEVIYSGFQAEGFAHGKEEPVVKAIQAAHGLVAKNECSLLASTATTDCRFFQLYGNTPATCYGPIAENIHGFNERVSIDSTLEVAQVLAVFMAHWCGLEEINP